MSTFIIILNIINYIYIFKTKVYGDVVNSASRMMAIASGGQIVVGGSTWDLIKTCKQFDFYR